MAAFRLDFGSVISTEIQFSFDSNSGSVFFSIWTELFC